MEAGATDTGAAHAERADAESGGGAHPPRAAPGLVASLAKAFSGLASLPKALLVASLPKAFPGLSQYSVGHALLAHFTRNIA